MGIVLNPLRAVFAWWQIVPWTYLFSVSGHRSVPIVAMVFDERGGEDFAIYQGGQFLTRLGLLPLTQIYCCCQAVSQIPILAGRVSFAWQTGYFLFIIFLNLLGFRIVCTVQSPAQSDVSFKKASTYGGFFFAITFWFLLDFISVVNLYFLLNLLTIFIFLWC